MADVAATVSYIAERIYSGSKHAEVCLQEFNSVGSISDGNLIPLRFALSQPFCLTEEDLPQMLKLLEVNRMLGQVIAGEISLDKIRQTYNDLGPLGLTTYARGISYVLENEITMIGTDGECSHRVDLLGECIRLRIRIRALWHCMLLR